MLHAAKREITVVYVRYGILGSTLVSGAPIGPRQVRTVLAVLLSQPNQPVSTEALAGELWPGSAPGSSDAVLQGRVSTLRKVLCPDLPARSPRQVIRTRQGSYTLILDEGELDAAEFSRLVEAGQRAAAQGDLVEAGRHLRDGLRLWRGPALQDTGRGPVLSAYAGVLEQQKLAALEQRFEVDIALGRLSEAIGGLTEQLSQDPTQENFAALLIEALVAAGRGAAARDVFDSTRAALERVGLVPGTRLYLAREQLQPEPQAPAITRPTTCPAEVPAQLPDFTGRGELLEQIRSALTGRGPRLVVLSGPGGVGKSTLAVRAAHLLRREFPGGQVVADLTSEPGRPSEVLRRFLLSIGVAEDAIPHGFVERQQLWRSRTADAKVLALLDDARDEAQVRALLPAGADCGVLVTSRRRMLGLAGAKTIAVEAFDQDESWELLSGIVGEQRIAAEPGSARKLVELCAGLPLAVRIVGAKLAARPHETVEELALRIGAGRGRLAELRAGDLDVRATIEVSYAECTEGTRRALRLLGAIRLPAVSRSALACLLDTPEETGADVAEALVEAQLLQVRGRDELGQLRYQPHDLIAEFAAEKARGEEPAGVLDAALDRMLDGYLAAGRCGGERHNPASWCAAEADNVFAVTRAAVERGWWERGWRLADSFAEVAKVRPGSASARNVTVLALRAARRSGDLRAEAISLRRLGELQWQQVKVASAVRYLGAAAQRFRGLDDGAELARTLVVEADVLAETGRVGQARDRLSTALEAAKQADDQRVHAAALDQLGGLHSDAGDFAEAQRCFVEALQLAREAGDLRGIVAIRKRLADVLRRAGRLDQAAELLAEALAGARETGDAHWEAHVLRSLGEVQRYFGDTGPARGSLARSLELFTEHGHRHAAAYSLRSLADLQAQVREYEQAGEALERCRTIFDALGDRRGQAYTLRSLGGLCVRTGRWVQAERSLRAALTIFDELSMRWFSQDAARALAQTRNWSSAS
ncbi:AfsR/SARP family transcriptional regulator [Amycolatopsis cihanbeyliensis]|uniref:AfsR/SARP family transcriptional regulator n=1 Tax=Amycolatopsis cihanbeyliensis TaxID=1128664 RepID=UPI00114EAA01|nr:BTAD domain-containing putative transcriptional regulator [Amycolatopsis cihanbeyliensis]